MGSGGRARPCLLAFCLGACATPPPACVAATPADDVVYVVSHGWHTDLGLPAATLRGPMARFRATFPGLRTLMVGYGRRSFLMAPVRTFGDLLAGPLPGSGALQVAAISATPQAAYRNGTVATLRLPPGGAERLSAFVWRSIGLDHAGAPIRLGAGFPGSVFYASPLGYSGLHTCNTWTAQALHAAGTGVAAEGVVLAGQVMARTSPRAENLCRIADGPPARNAPAASGTASAQGPLAPDAQ